MTRTERVEVAVWVLVYGGLIVFVLGLFVGRLAGAGSDALAALLMSAGGLIAGAGVVLIYVRSRMDAPPPSRQEEP